MSVTQPYHVSNLPVSPWKSEIGPLLEQTLMYNIDGLRELGMQILAKHIQKIVLICNDCMDKIDKITIDISKLSEEDFKLAHSAANRLQDIYNDLLKASISYNNHDVLPIINMTQDEFKKHINMLLTVMEQKLDRNELIKIQQRIKNSAL